VRHPPDYRVAGQLEEGTVDDVDLVVVGGGIAGSAIAGRMSAAGAKVLVLEQTERFTDRVRGEYIAAWGVREVVALGLWDVVEAVAHSNLLTHFVGFEERIAEDVALASMRDFTAMMPDVPGAFGVSHPGVSEALLAHAAACGAVVSRGTSSVSVASGATPTVCWRVGDDGFEVAARLVVAADGRASTLRRARGLTLHETQATRLLAGMLVADTDEWPRNIACHGVEGETEYIMFPQADGLTRVYVGWPVDQPARFAGPDRQRNLLDSLRLECTSWSPAIADGNPAGPCSWFPMTDSWLDDPVHDAIVFVGDAAGWSNPLIGQGLSVAIRDAHVLTDTLLADDRWTGDALRGYVDERTERMRRLRTSMAVSAIIYDFGPEAADRRARIRAAMDADPILAGSRATTIAGPWAFPDEAFADEAFAAIVAA
jgi:2-polyprenyl-6-methoxyphenol hydroxylase-like FAD-dependent oxidoreductase